VDNNERHIQLTEAVTSHHTVDLLTVDVSDDRAALGASAASAIADSLIEMLAQQESVRIVFAAAPSQTETLEALAGMEEIAWERVDAFHMDEYVGIGIDVSQRFGNWLRTAFFDRVPLRSVSFIDPDGLGADDPVKEARRYAALLEEQPIDVVLSGIGVTGHLAFNDPPVDFSETKIVKVVELEEASRQQQVSEGLFMRLADVPNRAWTITVPPLLSARAVFCMVPGELKRAAVLRALSGEIGADSPASALRMHPNARLFLDRDSSPFQ
jgi:glucosamine-6-phosphate deaminase